ncbi:MAG: hypothetical protein ACYDCM_07200 [Candidatus Acidiferrales bacterium]
MSIDNEQRHEEFRSWKKELDARCEISIAESADEINELEKLWELVGPNDNIHVAPSVGGSFCAWADNYCLKTFWGETAEADATHYAFNILRNRELHFA